MTNDLPLISVIIPAYNIEAYLEKCLCSVSDQTYPNIETIIVDDGSTDNTGVIADSFARQNDRFRVMHKTNAGANVARHDGLRASTGEFVFFVDGDDFLDNKCLERLHKAYSESGCDVVSARYIRICESYCSEETSTAGGTVMNHEEYIDALLTHRIKAYLAGKLFNRSLFEDVVFHPHIFMWEDFIINLQTVLSGRLKSVCFSSDAYYFYVQRRGSMIRGRDNFEYIEHFIDTTEQVYDAAPIKVDETLRLAEKVMRYNFYVRKSRNPWRGDSPAFMAAAEQVRRNNKELKLLIPPPAICDMLLYRNRRGKFLINLRASFRRWGRSLSRRTTCRLDIGELE